MRVRVHFNLHNRRWSVVDPATGRVIDSVTSVEIMDGECRVQKGARETVVRTGRRSVHAYVVGSLVSKGAPVDVRGLARFTYNPHRADHFHRADSTLPARVDGSPRMVFAADGSAWFQPT